MAATQALALDVWRKARLAVEANRPGVAARRSEIVAPDALPTHCARTLDAPSKLPARACHCPRPDAAGTGVAGLIKLAGSDIDPPRRSWTPSGACTSPEERNWAWGVMGKDGGAQNSRPDAMGYYANVTRDTTSNDDLLAWKVRRPARRTVEGGAQGHRRHGRGQRQDATWVYWKAVRCGAGRPSDGERCPGPARCENIAGPAASTGNWRWKNWASACTLPPHRAPDRGRENPLRQPRLNRGCTPSSSACAARGVREWNYTTNLHRPGGMNDRELLAAADLRLPARGVGPLHQHQRTHARRHRHGAALSHALPRRGGAGQAIGLDPAYVYGLIRQESRFIMDARSGVGASGLMQVMPATARWGQAHRADGLPSRQITDRDTNIAIGTATTSSWRWRLRRPLPWPPPPTTQGPGRPRLAQRGRC